MKAKKSFGQHFLNNESIAERIANSLSLDESYSNILEVGPGKGMLTKYLINKPCNLVVVEADHDMVAYLKRHYTSLNEQIISNDFLKVHLESIFNNESFALIGNFPYNISSQIVFKMLFAKSVIPEMVGMFQKEVAQRIIAKPGGKDYGVISVLVQAYYEGTYLFSVKNSNFSPPPKVQSGVIRLTRKETIDQSYNHKIFKRIVKTAFGQRRKMLRNSMKSIIPDNPMLKEPLFEKRPEKISVEEYINLAKRIEPELKEETVNS